MHFPFILLCLSNGGGGGGLEFGGPEGEESEGWSGWDHDLFDYTSVHVTF